MSSYEAMSHHICQHLYKITHSHIQESLGTFVSRTKCQTGFCMFELVFIKCLLHLIKCFFPLFILSKAKTCKLKAAFPAANVVCPLGNELNYGMRL